MRWNMILPILLSMVVGHLFTPVVRGDEIVKAGEIAKVDTNINTGATVTTYKSGHKITITPGPAGCADDSDCEVLFGVKIPNAPVNSVGAYETSQNAILAKSMAYNASVRKHQEAMARIRAASSGSNGRNGNGTRTRLNLNYRLN